MSALDPERLALCCSTVFATAYIRTRLPGLGLVRQLVDHVSCVPSLIGSPVAVEDLDRIARSCRTAG